MAMGDGEEPVEKKLKLKFVIWKQSEGSAGAEVAQQEQEHTRKVQGDLT